MDVVDPAAAKPSPRRHAAPLAAAEFAHRRQARAAGRAAAASLQPTALSTLLRCLAFAFWLTLSVAAHAEGVLLLTTSPSPPGRFVALEQAAREHGLPLRTRFIEKIAADELTPALWQAPSWCRCWAHCSRPATTPPRCSRRR
jgi:hypothetical protein